MVALTGDKIVISYFMGWETHIITETELSPYLRDSRRQDLPARIAALIEHQKASWPQLREGFESLLQVAIKQLPLRDFYVNAQHNPQRIRSTAAAVDKTSIQHRPCFLCAENLPLEEKGLAYGEDLVIFCNPFPIVNYHLSIIHRQHIEQAISGYFATMLDLARDLSPEYFVLYNGPKSGASAPDHLHFQAGRVLTSAGGVAPPKGRTAFPEGLPIVDHVKAIESKAELRSYKHNILNTTDLEIFTLENYHVNVLICHSQHRERLIDWFDWTLEALTEATGAELESMINLIVTHDGGAWITYLFPRAKHRPACYFAEGEDRLTVSPAAIDLAGWLVVPVEGHFQKIDSEAVSQIFSEVTLGEQPFSHVVKKLRGSPFTNR
jgi:ATP adenylyltransferase/5',5'''-P-1,P-4-tetraphosphate phosphorylase II